MPEVPSLSDYVVVVQSVRFLTWRPSSRRMGHFERRESTAVSLALVSIDLRDSVPNADGFAGHRGKHAKTSNVVHQAWNGRTFPHRLWFRVGVRSPVSCPRTWAPLDRVEKFGLAVPQMGTKLLRFPETQGSRWRVHSLQASQR